VQPWCSAHCRRSFLCAAQPRRDRTDRDHWSIAERETHQLPSAGTKWEWSTFLRGHDLAGTRIASTRGRGAAEGPPFGAALSQSPCCRACSCTEASCRHPAFPFWTNAPGIPPSWCSLSFRAGGTRGRDRCAWRTCSHTPNRTLCSLLRQRTRPLDAALTPGVHLTPAARLVGGLWETLQRLERAEVVLLWRISARPAGRLGAKAG
jgi:hypothetical protein